MPHNKYRILKNDLRVAFMHRTKISILEHLKRSCAASLKTFLLICAFYTCSISLTFYNKQFINFFRFPLSITITHLVTKFVLSALIRWILFCRTGSNRVTLGWIEYIKRIAPSGITGSLDIGLSNWSFEFITISLYTMTKTTCIIFILIFSIAFKLEKPKPSLILVVLLIAIGLFMFTYESTQFNIFGFLLVFVASVISGLRWTVNQMVLQRKDIGLSHPVDMMYHVQPWMVLSLIPLSAAFEGLRLSTNERAFAFHESSVLYQNLGLLFAGAFLAFLLEYSEFLLVCHTSGLTLAIAGIFKEVITLLLAAFINDDSMNTMNAIGLIVCLLGIALHIFLKRSNDTEEVIQVEAMKWTDTNSR